MANEQTELDIIIRVKALEEGAKQTAAQLKQLQGNAKTSTDLMQKGANQANQSFLQTKKTVEAVGKSMMIIGSVAMVAMVNSAKSYVANMGTAESTSRQWLQATYDIASAQNRIGRDIAQVLLPGYKELAKLAGEIADFLDKHPEVTKVGVGVAGVAGTVAAGYGAVQTYKIATALGALAGGGAAIAGAAKVATTATGGVAPFIEDAAVAAAVAKPGILATLAKGTMAVLKSPAMGIAGSVIGGLLLGGAGANWLAGTKIGKEAGVATWQQGATVGGAMLGTGASFLTNIIPDIAKFGFSLDTLDAATKQAIKDGDSWGVSIGRLLGVIAPAAEKQTISTEQLRAGLAMRRADQQQERAYNIQTSHMNRDFAIQEQYATEDFQRQQMRSVRDFNLQMEYSAEDFQRQRTRSNRDFNLQLTYSEEDFYRQRAIANRDFNIQMTRNDQDHQLSVARNAQDHSFDMFQLALSGDAMSMWLAQRQYNLQKQRDEEDYQRQKSRSEEDFNRQEGDATTEYGITRARQLQQYAIQEADAIQDFNIGRARELVQFAIQQGDAQVDFDLQRKRAADQFKIQLDDMAQQFNEERLARSIAFEDQLLDLAGAEERRRTLLNEFSQIQLDDLQKFIDAANKMLTGNPYDNAPTKQSGGDISATGLYRLHAGETVLNPAVTAAAENAGRYGTSVQDTVMRLIMGAGSSKVYQDQRVYNAEVSAQTRKEIQNDTLMALAEAFK